MSEKKTILLLFISVNVVCFIWAFSTYYTLSHFFSLHQENLWAYMFPKLKTWSTSGVVVCSSNTRGNFSLCISFFSRNEKNQIMPGFSPSDVCISLGKGKKNGKEKNQSRASIQNNIENHFLSHRFHLFLVPVLFFQPCKRRAFFFFQYFKNRGYNGCIWASQAFLTLIWRR